MKQRYGMRGIVITALAMVMWSGGAGAGEPTKVRFSHFTAFHTLGVYVAYEKGFYRDEGLDVQLHEASSGAQQPLQLVAGEVDITSMELHNVARLQHEGKKVIWVFDYVKRMSMDLVVHNDVLNKAGVKPSDPLEKKLQGLKGLKIGYTGPNAPTDVYSRYYLQKAGLVPGKDAEMVSIGGPPSLLAALKSRRIDAFMLTAPTPNMAEKEGYGTILIKGSAGEVRELDNYPYYGMAIMEAYGAQQGDVVRRFIRATRRGMAYLRSDQEGTLQAARAFFKRMDPEALRLGYQAALPAYSEDGRITEEMVSRFLDLAFNVKVLSLPQRPSPKEGVLWTNRFIE